MGIPNTPDAAYVEQAEPDSVDFQFLFSQMQYGTFGGLAVTAQAIPNATAAVAAGTALVNGTFVDYAGGTATFANGGSDPRFDLVVLSTAGTMSVVQGTAATAPVFPAVSASQLMIAAVYIPAGNTVIEDELITDKRIMLPRAITVSAEDEGDVAVTLRDEATGTSGLTITAGGRIAWASDAGSFSKVPSEAAVLANGSFKFSSALAGSGIPLRVERYNGQTTDLTRWVDHLGNVLARVDSNANLTTANWKRGTGDPLGSVVGSVSDVYQRTDGGSSTSLYIKESGTNNTSGWVPIYRTDSAPPGSILMYPVVTPPAGWLLCNGALVSTVTYSDLFALCGHTFNDGVDPGGSQFRLPNFSGRMPIGVGSAGTGPTRVLGARAGAPTVSLTTEQLPTASRYLHANNATIADYGAVPLFIRTPGAAGWNPSLETGHPASINTFQFQSWAHQTYGPANIGGVQQTVDTTGPHQVVYFIIKT